MDAKEKLTALRAQIEKQTLDGYIQPLADEWQSHFIPDTANRLRRLTGFTGSAGIAVILTGAACVLSDSRYTIQLKQQIENSLYDMEDVSKKSAGKWLSENTKPGMVIGYNPALMSITQREAIERDLKDDDVTLTPVGEDLIDRLWQRAREVSQKPVRIFSNDIAGKTPDQKIEDVVAALQKDRLDYFVITHTPSLCWLLNVRGDDQPCLPVVNSYGVINVTDNEVDWYVDPANVNDTVRTHVGNHVFVKDIETLDLSLAQLKGRVGLDKSAPDIFLKYLDAGDCTPVLEKSPIPMMMAVKTESEIEAMKDVHVRDGAAVTRLLYWVATTKHSDIYESDIAAKFEEIRKEQSNTYREPSFPPIIGYGANGAIVHYKLEPGERGAKLDAPHMLLMDTGGQYEDGTTDITRTVFYGSGTPSADMKRHFTLVLKGHIALALARFPKGTTGAQVDTLARKALWAEGLNYGHGTGHGVGVALDVHEESANIHPRGHTAFKPGMIITNEPGYYQEGAYGIRIENILVVKEASSEDMLEFETITLAPLDRNLIDASMLEKSEIAWVNAYHARVYGTLSPHLEGDVKEWLKEQTKPL